LHVSHWILFCHQVPKISFKKKIQQQGASASC
jgi:hypothetical protein